MFYHPHYDAFLQKIADREEEKREYLKTVGCYKKTDGLEKVNLNNLDNQVYIPVLEDSFVLKTSTLRPRSFISPRDQEEEKGAIGL